MGSDAVDDTVNFTGNTIVEVSDSQVEADIGDERILLELESGTYFGLNGVGADIWEFLSDPRRVDEIEAYLLESYEIGRERVEADIETFLHELHAAELITVEYGDDGDRQTDQS